jgi:cytochrome c oxidase assembly factor CtaG
LLWGLPDVVRRPVGRALGNVLHKQTVSGGIIRSVTTPGVIYLAFIIVVFGWHDPDLYNAALRSELVHDLEHITFFLAGMLFWWQVIGAGPVIHKQFGQIGRIVFTLAAIPPNMILGIVLAFTPVVIYTFYNDAPRLLNMSALTDQQLSGIIMWIPGSMMYLIAALVLIAGLLKREDKKPIKTRPAWSADEIVAAPGVPPPGSSV